MQASMDVSHAVTALADGQ